MSDLENRFEVFVTTEEPCVAYIKFRFRSQGFSPERKYEHVGDVVVPQEDFDGCSDDRKRELIEAAISMAHRHCTDNGRQLSSSNIFLHSLPGGWEHMRAA